MLLLVLGFLIANLNAYGTNMCRTFSEEELVKDFDFAKFLGNWFPKFTSKDSPYVFGQCPITYFERTQAEGATPKRLIKKSSSVQKFTMSMSYKGLLGIVDNERKYRGLFEGSSSRGSLWVGVTAKPLKKYMDNFKVVSTDYENYAILY